MDTRDLLHIDNVLECNPDNFIRDVIAPNIDLTPENIADQRHVIPALVPPLRLKPILSHRYIELWSKTSQWVNEAKHIIIVGYSFNNADEHFNDILRNYPDRHIDIVVPEATSEWFVNRMEKVFGIAANQYNNIYIGPLAAKKARKIRLISAKATEVDLDNLFGTSFS